MDWKELLAKAQPKVITVQVEMDYNDADGNPVVESFPLGLLSYGEWLGIDAEVVEPPIPRSIAGANGIRLPNRDDVKYRAELAATMNERSYRRLALALEKAGVKLPEGTDEKLKVIQQMDARIANVLMTKLAEHVFGGKAETAAAADSFR